MEVDLTERLFQFRNLIRFIWNQHFRLEPVEKPDCPRDEIFQPIYSSLFDGMVLWGLPAEARMVSDSLAGYFSIDAAKFDAMTLPEKADLGVHHEFHVLPLSLQPTLQISDGPGRWDYPVTWVEASEVELRLISLFDWDEQGFRDWRYYQVRIVKATNLDLVGRNALIEANDCRVVFRP